MKPHREKATIIPILPTYTFPFRYPQIRGTLAEEHRAARTGIAHEFSCQHRRCKARIFFFFFSPANASGLLARASSPLPGLPKNICITKFKIIVLIHIQFLWEQSALCFTGRVHTLLLSNPFLWWHIYGIFDQSTNHLLFIWSVCKNIDFRIWVIYWILQYPSSATHEDSDMPFSLLFISGSLKYQLLFSLLDSHKLQLCCIENWQCWH